MVDIIQLLDEADDLRNKQGNLSGALEKINQVLEFEPENFQVMVIKSVLLRDLGYLDEAEKILQTALEKIKNTDNHYLVLANIWRLLGCISLLRGNTDTALEQANKSLNIASELDSFEMLANVQALLGNIYQITCDTTQALDYYNQALTSAEEVRFIEREITVSINIATIQSELGYKDEALAMLDKIVERAQNRWYKALFNALFEKGKILLVNHKIDQEYIDQLQSAYKIAAANGWNYEQGNLSLQLGRIFVFLKENDNAREYLQTAKLLFEKSGMKLKQKTVAEELAKI